MRILIIFQALPIERCPQFRDQPPGSTATYNGKCYIFYNRQPQTFRDALALCKGRGGTLVDESNPALQGFISWELWRRHRCVILSLIRLLFFTPIIYYAEATPTVSTGWAPCVIPRTKTTGSGSTVMTSLFPSGTFPAATKIARATTALRAGSGPTLTAMPNSTTFASIVSFITETTKKSRYKNDFFYEQNLRHVDALNSLPTRR